MAHIANDPADMLGGSTQLPDADRWRALGAAAGVDLPTMIAAGLRLRPEFATLGLERSLRALAALAEGSHAFARLVQADLEAVLTLGDAGRPVPDEVVVQFPRDEVTASRGADGGWRLDGVQHRSVHPEAVDLALVPARVAGGGELLFACRMSAPGVVRDRSPLRTIAPQDPNGPVTFHAVAVETVGPDGWWAARPVTFDGLLRDAACWFGSCVWLCRTLETMLARRPAPDRKPVGRVDVWVYSARVALRDAVRIVGADPTGPRAELAARRGLAVVATTVDTVIRTVALLSDARVGNDDDLLPTRVAQLQIALRRFDADANLRAIAGLVALTPGRAPD